MYHGLVGVFLVGLAYSEGKLNWIVGCWVKYMKAESDYRPCKKQDR